MIHDAEYYGGDWEDDLPRYEQGDLQLCVGHEGWIGLGPEYFEFCLAHDISSDDEDSVLELPVEPSAFINGVRGQLWVGGRNELLQLRDDLDQVLERLP